MFRRSIAALFACAFVFTVPTFAEEIKLATYNIEHFDNHFLGHHLDKAAATQPVSPEMKKMIDLEKRQNDKENWAVSLVITDDRFSPDILAIEECADQDDLDFFNRRWLGGMYETVIVFPSNTKYHQHVAMMLKPGFKVLDRKDQYHTEPDTEATTGNRLFARGPAFLLVESPSGYKFWVGVTHQKSKLGTRTDAEIAALGGPEAAAATKPTKDEEERMRVTSAKWRVRESKRTHQIIKELEAAGPTDVVLLGDMNDDLGMDEPEKAINADGITELVGPQSDGFVLATKRLADAGEISYGGYFNPRYRSLIDHAIMTRSMGDQVEEVSVFKRDLAKVASDHFPVLVRIKADPVTPTTAPSAPVQ
jgi:endonuclease/exonuclease/phosphatase family metal-dependent hydrolase